MRTGLVPKTARALLHLSGLLPLSCLVSTLIGCGAASNPASVTPTAPAEPTSTVKPKFAYTGNQGASLSGYAVDPSTGSLTPLAGFPFAAGTSPQYVTHDPGNRFLIASDISANMLHVYAINANTGALTEVGPSPYNTMIESEMVAVDPSGTHVYLYRTGSSDFYPGVSGSQIVAFNLTSAGVLTPVTGSPFATGVPLDSAFGMVIDAAGKFLYLKDSSHLFTFGIDAATGSLALLQTLPSQEFGGIAIDPAGKYLYAVGGSSSFQAYAIDAASGLLSLAKTTPAAESGAYTIAVSPNGNYAYTIENNNDLVSYTVSNGVFTPVGLIYSGVYGEQIVVDPSNSFVYVPQACSYCSSSPYNIVHEFAITKTGALTPLATPSVAAGVTPWNMTIISQ